MGSPLGATASPTLGRCHGCRQLRAARRLSRELQLARRFPPQQLFTANSVSQIQFSRKENLIISIKKPDLPFREPKQDALLQLLLTLIRIFHTVERPQRFHLSEKKPGRVPVPPPTLREPQTAQGWARSSPGQGSDRGDGTRPPHADPHSAGQGAARASDTDSSAAAARLPLRPSCVGAMCQQYQQHQPHQQRQQRQQH